MTRDTQENTPPKPADPREARLKAALKANLARRKAQARARGAGQDDSDPSTAGPATGKE